MLDGLFFPQLKGALVLDSSPNSSIATAAFTWIPPLVYCILSQSRSKKTLLIGQWFPCPF
uniref:Uncharacterized protein n=1 Tax=Rhizophora mucronata TaxID=61149 RepID=A0A2P2R0E3_RHIMU